MSEHYPIAVVGAGLGGLVVARVLRVNGVEAAVFEVEASAGVRGQGGMLDIHEESGQVALRAAGLYAEFRALVHPGGEALRVVDKWGRLRLAEEDDGTGGRPEVDRGQLRDLLLGSLAGDTVHWGRKVVAVKSIGDGVHEVGFADGTSITTDLLIGADGAWSRVRPLLSGAVPAYTGISFIEVDLLDADERHPGSAALIGPGSFMCLGDGKGFLAHRESDGSLHVYVALPATVDWLAGVTDPEVIKAAALARFDGWADELRALIVEADGGVAHRLIHALPVGHRWAAKAGVTLVGDAAHLMSPFAGEGANLAMLDGAELALAVAGGVALAEYERELFARSEVAAAESAANLEMMFGVDGLDRLLGMFAGGQP
ncbi:FAD-dependent oxidoreductase [Actinokineospora inagensis]|uniref:FAD-dependent oxidoreductase n=1 Tax=Actinokineospora inagensis TaxID=103730 RepID=UPI000419E225|nr:NAD(P)/FAD-dependent oxidoreductase [Actinokineospora inagensis]